MKSGGLFLDLIELKYGSSSRIGLTGDSSSNLCKEGRVHIKGHIRIRGDGASRLAGISGLGGGGGEAHPD